MFLEVSQSICQKYKLSDEKATYGTISCNLSLKCIFEGRNKLMILIIEYISYQNIYFEHLLLSKFCKDKKSYIEAKADPWNLPVHAMDERTYESRRLI